MQPTKSEASGTQYSDYVAIRHVHDDVLQYVFGYLVIPFSEGDVCASIIWLCFCFRSVHVASVLCSFLELT